MGEALQVTQPDRNPYEISALGLPQDTEVPGGRREQVKQNSFRVNAASLHGGNEPLGLRFFATQQKLCEVSDVVGSGLRSVR
jgi:hypothetical protein